MQLSHSQMNQGKAKEIVLLNISPMHLENVTSYLYNMALSMVTTGRDMNYWRVSKIAEIVYIASVLMGLVGVYTDPLGKQHRCLKSKLSQPVSSWHRSVFSAL